MGKMGKMGDTAATHANDGQQIDVDDFLVWIDCEVNTAQAGH